MFPVSRTLDRYETTFDHDGLIANAGLIMIATLMSRLGLEQLANKWVHTGSFAPGRKICTLIAAMIAGATHIDHVNMLRAGATQMVLPFKVMAPSTIGTFLRSFTFGFVRQLDAVDPRQNFEAPTGVLVRGYDIEAKNVCHRQKSTDDPPGCDPDGCPARSGAVDGPSTHGKVAP